MIVTCQCGKEYQLPASAAGRKFRCRACEAVIDVPTEIDEVEFEEPESNVPSRRNGRKQAAGKKAGSRVLPTILVLLGIGGLALLLCCGGVGFVSYKFADALSFDPVIAEQTTDEIAEIEIPESLYAIGSISIEPFLGIPEMKMAFYQDPAPGVLVIAQMGFPYDGSRPTDAQIEKLMQDASQIEGGEPRRIRVTDQEFRTYTIRGQNVEFIFAEGVDRDTGDDFRQVVGMFPGRAADQSAMVIYQIHESAWDEEVVVRMIESIE